MRYLGGKARIAAALSRVVGAEEGDLYIEPFLGSGAMFEKVAPYYPEAIASDAHEDLMLMWQAVADGWVPPTYVTKAKYEELRHAEPSALRGYAGFCYSYAGLWFKSYADHGNAKANQSAAMTQRRVVTLTGRRLGRHTLLHCDYAEHTPRMRPGVVVYCDPPYAENDEWKEREGYSGVNGGTFDHARFWQTMDEWSDLGATVLVSEYSAPAHWKEWWSVERRTYAFPKGSAARRVERLFKRT